MADHPESPDNSTANKRSIFSALAIDLTPLRTSRDFRLLYIGQFVSAFGSSISYVVLPWQMYQLTKSNFAVGMLGVAEFLPMLVMAFVGGALADFIDRRRLIVIAETGLVICCGLLVANALLPQPRTWVLFVVAALFAALNGVHRPAMEAMTPRLVEPEQNPAVASLGMVRYGFSFIVGPALAGLIATGFGAAVAFAIDAATFIVSIVALLLLRRITMPARLNEEERPNLQSVINGL